MVRTQWFQCQGPGSIPGQGTEIPHKLHLSDVLSRLQSLLTVEVMGVGWAQAPGLCILQGGQSFR